jgi:predicted acylesterase/phospholipase RssA
MQADVRTIVLSGGFMRGISILAVTSELDELRIIPRIKTFVGCSVGSVIAFLLIIGYSSNEIYEVAMSAIISNLQNDLVKSIVSLGLQPSLVSKVVILDVIAKLIEKKRLRKDITLSELFKITKKNLVITVWNADSSRTEYFTARRYPDLPCMKALEASISVPLFFSSVEINGETFFDGGTGGETLPYKVSEDCPETLVVVVNEFPVENLGRRKVVKIRSEIHSFSVMTPVEDIKRQYIVSKLRARRVLNKEKKE